ncbi:magnesium transporter [Accumulibacter sp.]|uniref:magnesium transporter n=1 Tax=Accumulibacter sp. TaxID=2053492 RepID=UPI0025F16DFE|nr:magnesium transporter [Accumulibacter sp.]MCM8595832.1 magnesium transporter [Accumulibacter sp.]MCM8626553.1 magnesium transporter [Accumulibacter sp.]MDS4049980.1 magnesium transporter [Accumulibacter sp.]
MFIDTENKAPRPEDEDDSKAKLLIETIGRLYDYSAHRSLKRMLAKISPQDLASILEALTRNRVAGVFCDIQEKEVAAEVLKLVSPELREFLLTDLPPTVLSELVLYLSPEALTDLLGSLDEAQRDRLLAILPKDDQEDVESLLRYPPDTAGGIMTTDVFSLPLDTPVEEAIKAIRTRDEQDTVFYLYVTGLGGRLVGVISLRQLLLAPPEARLEELMNPQTIMVTTDTKQETVARLVDKHNLLALPVVDGENVLVGAVTVDNVLDVIQSETTKEMLRMAGTSESEILAHSPFRIARIRLPWLLAAFGGGLAATGVIEHFEGILARVLALSAFLPVIMGMAGNVGVQSATVAVRGLATGAIDLRHTGRFLFKEFRVGLILGALYGTSLGLFGYFVHHSLALGQVVGFTILGNMTGAAILAVVLPMMFHRMKIDPAIATGPFVTTAIDVLGVLNYFAIATAIYGLG